MILPSKYLFITNKAMQSCYIVFKCVSRSSYFFFKIDETVGYIFLLQKNLKAWDKWGAITTLDSFLLYIFTAKMHWSSQLENMHAVLEKHILEMNFAWHFQNQISWFKEEHTFRFLSTVKCYVQPKNYKTHPKLLAEHGC